MRALFGVKQTHPTNWHAYLPGTLSLPLHHHYITHSIIHDDKEVGEATRLLFAPGPVTVQFNFEKKFHDETVAVFIVVVAAVVFALLSHKQKNKDKHKFLIQTACSDRVIEPRKQHTAYSKGLHTRLANQTGNWLTARVLAILPFPSPLAPL